MLPRYISEVSIAIGETLYTSERQLQWPYRDDGVSRWTTVKVRQ